MSNYVIVDSIQLESDLTTVADAIREKSGTSDKLSFPSGMASAVKAIDKLEIVPLPLLADFTVEEDVVNIDIPLSSPAKRQILVYTELPSEKTLTNAYPRYNGWLVDMTLSDMKAGSKRWLECVLMDGGYSRWIWSSAKTGEWDGSPTSICDRGVLVNRNSNSEIESFGYGIATVSAGTRIRVWGE